MNAVTLAPVQNQLYRMHAQNAHPRYSVRRALYAKFVRWIDKTPGRVLAKVLLWTTISLMLFFLVVAPWPTLDLMVRLLEWNNFSLPLYCSMLSLLLNAKRLWRWLRRPRATKQTGNQFTFHGVPVGALAQFLSSHGSFKQKEAIHELALSQGQYAKIGEELEKHGLLIRGEKNARVLREIEYDALVRQLRDDFPLVYDTTRKEWLLRDGMFNRFVLDSERREQKEQQKIERKERAIKRLDKKIEERREELAQEPSVFASVFAHSPVIGQ